LLTLIDCYKHYGSSRCKTFYLPCHLVFYRSKGISEQQ
jgi:hypothetical protein